MGSPSQDSLLRRFRRLAAGTTKKRVQGRSLELDLALSGVKRLEPAFETHRQPVFAWAAVVWDQTAPVGLLQASLDDRPRLENCKFPSATVVGPAGALQLTLRRIG